MFVNHLYTRTGKIVAWTERQSSRPSLSAVGCRIGGALGGFGAATTESFLSGLSLLLMIIPAMVKEAIVRLRKRKITRGELGLACVRIQAHRMVALATFATLGSLCTLASPTRAIRLYDKLGLQRQKNIEWIRQIYKKAAKHLLRPPVLAIAAGMICMALTISRQAIPANVPQQIQVPIQEFMRPESSDYSAPLHRFLDKLGDGWNKFTNAELGRWFVRSYVLIYLLKSRTH